MRVPNTALITVLYLAWPVVGSRISLGCLLFMQPCVSPEICKSELLRNICSSKDSGCETLSSERCNVTIQALLTHYSNCKHVCTEDDPCSTLQLLSSSCQSYSGTVYLILKLILSLYLFPNTDPRSDSSCLQVMTRCVGDEVCNRQLVPFVQSCSETQCEGSSCRLATRSFFTGLPQNTAEMLMFCQCEEADQDCRDVQNILQSSSCSANQTPWNCLEMLESCSAERLCRQTFEGFLSKCFGSEEASFSGYSTRELLHLIDADFFRSGDKECRKAFVATMGSPLQSPCTCHGLHHENSYRCNMLKQAVQNRTQFSKYLCSLYFTTASN
ncbi:GDNF family receptor alpha-like [Astyanax mexicanus]|uniref:GDNF family receptor alpha-like n=1 Tax=Astyanax mexicanus TaxID=7994 RepID=UPI0020CB1092|nr:GDNF family receptor alpha-like [Astyanax mexicanus]